MTDVIDHKSGLTIITDHTDSPLISMRLRVAVGKINEDKKVAGISHFVEHMVFNGTSTKTKNEITMPIEKTGGTVNAYTSNNETCYIVECIQTNQNKGFDTIFDIVRNASFPEDSFEKEKNVILQEYFDGLDDIGRVCGSIATNFFNESPQTQGQIIGTEDTIKNISLDSLKSFYSDYYIPENMIFSISGDFDENIMNEYLEKFFPEIDGVKKDKTNKISNITFTPGLHREEYKFDTSQVFFKYELNINSRKDSLVYSIINQHLGSGFSSLLFQKIREELGLVYQIGSQIYNNSGQDLMYIHAGCIKENIDKILEETPKEILNLRNITEDEFSDSKNKILYSILRSFDTKSNNASKNLSQYINWKSFVTYKDLLDLIQDIKIEDVQSSIEEIINQEPVVVIITPAQNS